MKRRSAALLAASVVASLWFASTAHAEDIHFTEPEFCQEFDDGSRTCSSSEGLYHIVLTSKGYAVVGNGTTHFSFSSPTSSIEDTVKYNTNWLVKDNVDQVLTIRSSETYIVDGRTCILVTRYHFSNGDIRFSRSDLTCA